MCVFVCVCVCVFVCVCVCVFVCVCVCVSVYAIRHIHQRCRYTFYEHCKMKLYIIRYSQNIIAFWCCTSFICAVLMQLSLILITTSLILNKFHITSSFAGGSNLKSHEGDTTNIVLLSQSRLLGLYHNSSSHKQMTSMSLVTIIDTPSR